MKLDDEIVILMGRYNKKLEAGQLVTRLDDEGHEYVDYEGFQYANKKQIKADDKLLDQFYEECHDYYDQEQEAEDAYAEAWDSYYHNKANTAFNRMTLSPEQMNQCFEATQLFIPPDNYVSELHAWMSHRYISLVADSTPEELHRDIVRLTKYATYLHNKRLAFQSLN